MSPEVTEEVQRLIKEYKLNCTIEQFKYKVYWNHISLFQKLSEDFIREFIEYVDIDMILDARKHLSEQFKEELKALKAIKEI